MFVFHNRARRSQGRKSDRPVHRRRLRLERLEERTLLNAGILDPTYGTNGMVMTQVSTSIHSTESASDVAVQPDGKIVGAGYLIPDLGTPTATDFVLVRYNADGSLDTTFGTSGISMVPSKDIPDQVALQPDGKIVVVGRGELARFTSSGAPDPTFGNAGVVTLASAGTFPRSLVLQPDGKILVSGANGQVFATLRFNADGSPDPSFGANGQVTLIFTGQEPLTQVAIALQHDGRILVIGSQGGMFNFLERLNPDGSVDTSFGSAGFMSLSYIPQALAVQPNGRIVVAGETNFATGPAQFEIGRFDINGATDVTFGNNGITPVPGAAINAVVDLLIQPDGKTITVRTNGDAGNNLQVIRTNPDGALDATFGTGGATTTPIGFAEGAALQPDGEIVAVSFSSTSPGSILSVRYTADPPIADANQRFLSQVYLDLLQRPIDSSGLATWTNALAAGSTRTQVVAAIQTSQEYRTLEVEYLYGFLLRRPADAGGLASWVQFLSQGGAFEQVEAQFLGSQEYFVNQGSTNAGFLQRVYFDMLQRQIDSSGMQTWTQALASGASRSAVAAAILGSLEFDTVMVEALYQALLRRPVDSSGLSTFTTALQSGVPTEAVTATLVGSDEYFQLF